MNEYEVDPLINWTSLLIGVALGAIASWLIPYIYKRVVRFMFGGTMKLDSLIANSRALDSWLDSHITGVAIPTDTRTRLAAGCLDVALEHHRAIVLLIANRLYGSAFALVRTIFESYVRGVWLHRCASDADLDRFQRDKLNRAFGDVIADIEKLDGFDIAVLSRVKDQWWAPMNSFAHSGFLQVVRRVRESEIAATYDHDEICEALRFADAIALLSAGCVAQIGNNTVLLRAVLEKQGGD